MELSLTDSILHRIGSQGIAACVGLRALGMRRSSVTGFPLANTFSFTGYAVCGLPSTLLTVTRLLFHMSSAHGQDGWCPSHLDLDWLTRLQNLQSLTAASQAGCPLRFSKALSLLTSLQACQETERLWKAIEDPGHHQPVCFLGVSWTRPLPCTSSCSLPCAEIPPPYWRACIPQEHAKPCVLEEPEVCVLLW